MSFSELPPGYSYDFYRTDQRHFDYFERSQEIVDLYLSDQYEPSDSLQGDLMLDIDSSYRVVGVRSEQYKLVGIGFLDSGEIDSPAGSGETLEVGELYGLTVHPDHRNKGIGGAILAKRVEYADRLRLHCFCRGLESTNTMPHKYRSLGFVALHGGLFRPSPFEPLK